MNFSNSIKIVNNFVRPIRTVIKYFGNNDPIPGSGTMFFVNDNGVAVSCKHISNILRNVSAINQNWENYLTEKSELKRRSEQKGLAKQFGFNSDSTIQIIYTVVNSFDAFTTMTIHEHPQLDLAIIEFKGFKSIAYTGHAVFPSHNNFVEQGEFFCRLGFPFPEFTNFQFNQTTEKLEWTSSGNLSSPIFPIEGMVTRKLKDSNGSEVAIELSRPGLRGQSGGPLFDAEGLIFGMQTSTKHLHLGFDIVDKEEYIKNRKKRISHYPYLNLGICINHIEIKKWLDQHNISYSTK